MSQSLLGVRALVTRPAGQGDALVAAIRKAGGEAVALPLIRISPLGDEDAPLLSASQRILAQLESFDIAIFISTNAVGFTFATLQERGLALPSGLRCLAVGGATAARLREAGIACASGTTAMNSEELLQLPALADPGGRRVVIFKGRGGRELLARELAARGALVSECALYRREAPQLSAPELAQIIAREQINVLLLSSGDALENLLGLPGVGATGTIGAQLRCVVPGQRVAAQARRAGLNKLHIAANATDGAMLEALREILHQQAD